jgi:hypothetical protein
MKMRETAGAIDARGKLRRPMTREPVNIARAKRAQATERAEAARDGCFVCGWCGSVLHDTNSRLNGTTSHGICHRCAERAINDLEDSWHRLTARVRQRFTDRQS